MNSERSYSDHANTGQHHPGSEASLDHISRALDDLESHLGRLLHQPAPTQPNKPEKAPFLASAGGQLMLPGDFRQLIQEELAREFSVLRRDLTEAISTHPALAETVELAARLERLSDAVFDLTRRSESATPAALYERLEEIAQAIGNLPDSLSLRALDERVRMLAMALNELLSGTMLGNPEQYVMIDERLNEISRAIASLSACSGTTKLNPEPFERIEARIASLAHQVSDLAAGRIDQEAADRICAQMHSLCLRVDEIARRVDMPEQMAARLVQQAARLEELLNIPDDRASLLNVEARLDDISERLQAPAHHADRGDDEAIRRLEAQIVNLSKQLAEPARRQTAHEGTSRQDEAQRLHDALTTLKAATRKSDERNAKTFEAIHDTLLKIVGRFDLAEQTPPLKGSEAQAADTPSAQRAEEATEACANEPDETQPVARAEDAGGPSPSAKMPTASVPEVDLDLTDVSGDLNAVLRRLRGDGGTSKADFIATARRAAQAATVEAEITQNNASGNRQPRASRGLSRFLKRAGASAALFIGTCVALYGGWQWGGELFAGGQTGSQKIEEIAKAAPVKPVARAASADKTAGTQRPVRVLDKKIVKHDDQIPDEPAAIPYRNDDVDDVVSTDRIVTAALPHKPLEVPEAISSVPLREAAARNDAKALFEIGDRYALGRGVEANPEEARRWFDRAASLGFAPAQYRLGVLYRKGQGGTRDLARARQWFERAADQGNTLAMHNLGLMAATGANGAPDHRAAARWFLEAAERGLKDSQFNLGILSTQGRGMAQDLEEAYKWFDLAAGAGDLDAAARRDKITEALTAEQLTRAKGKAILWKAKPSDPDANIVDLPEAWSSDKTTASGGLMMKSIANIQSILNRQGFDAGAADGVLGEKTRSAISAFQTANGMTPDGELDDAFVRALLARRDQARAG